MRYRFAFASALIVTAVTSASSTAGAQNGRVFSTPLPRVPRSGEDDQPRAVLGLSTGGSTSARDTLGLLVTSVVTNGPAERAGIQEGDRIASINGVNLRLSQDDVGDFETSSAMTRRLTRELGKVRPGEEVDLRVTSEGRTRTVHIRTADSDSLYAARRRVSSNVADDRPSLGLGIAATNSRRDSLGVLVMYVDDDGPAARAGIEEGNRIAAIENVDLRVSRDDSGDDMLASSKVRRLQREVSQLHPGDDVRLRVYANGDFRTVRLRVARASDLPHRHRAFMITGDGMNMTMPPSFPFGEGAVIGADVRESIERAMQNAGRALEGVGRGLGRGRALWQNDSEDAAPRARRVEPIEPIRIEPPEPPRIRARASASPRYRSTFPFEDRSSAAAGALARREAAADADRNAAVEVSGLRMVPVGSELASYLGRGSERGLLVISVPQWARDVLRAGDVVLSVDGQAVRTDDSSDDVAVALSRSRDAQLEIMRDHSRRTITLPARP